MKNLIVVLLSLLSGLYSTLHAQNKTIEKIQVNLAKGNYLEAGKLNKSFIKKNKNIPLSLAQAYLFQAEIHAGLGEFGSIGTQINYAAGLLGQQDSLLANAYVKASEIYLLASLPVEAQEHMRLAEKSKWSNNLIKESVYLRAKVKLCIKVGLYTQADSLLPFYKSAAETASNQRTIYEWKKKKIKERKLSKWETQERQRLLADAVNLQLELALKRGHLTLVDELIKNEEKKIKTMLGSTDRIYLDFKRLEANCLEQKHEYKEAHKLLDRLILDCKGSSKGVNYSRGSTQVFEMIRVKIALHLILDDPLSAESENDRYLKYLRVYAKKNPWQTELRTLATDQIAISRRNVLSAEKSLVKKLQNTDRIPLNHELRVVIHQALVRLHNKQNQLEKALENQEEILNLNNSFYPPESALRSLAQLNLLGMKLSVIHDFRTIRLTFHQEVSLQIDRQYHPFSEIRLRKNILEADLLSLEDEHIKAYTIFEKIQADSKNIPGNNNEVLGLVLGKQADCALTLGRLEESAALFEKSLQLLKEEKGTKSPEFITTLQAYARLFLLQANYEKSESILDRSESLDKRSSRNLKKEQNLQLAATRAAIFMRRGQYQEAGEYIQALKSSYLTKFGASHRFLIDIFLEQATLELISGQYTEADQSIGQALKICESVFPTASLRASEAIFMRSQVLHAMGDYKDAEALQKAVLKLYTQLLGEKHYRLAGVYNQLALTCFLGKSDRSEAEFNFKEAYRIGKEALSEKHPLTADYAKNLAYFFIETGQTSKALSLLEKSEEIYKDIFGKRSLKVAEIKYLLGDIHCLDGDYKTAAARYDDAVKFITETFGPEHPELVKVRGKQARMFYSSGRWQESAQLLQITTEKYLSFITKYFPTLSDRQKSQYWNSIKPDFQLFAHIAASKVSEDPQLAGVLYDHILNTKAILLSSSLKIRESIRSKGDTTLSQLFDEWVANRELLASSLSMSAEDLLLGGISLPQLEKKIEEIERKLNAASAEFTQSLFQKKVTWKEVQASLLSNEVAIEIIRYPTFNKGFTDTIQYAALVLKPDNSQPNLVSIPGGNDLDGKYYKYYKNAFRFGNEDLLSFKNYWEAISPMIPEDALIILSPDGIYSQINVLTLKDPNRGYVLDRNEVALVSNTKDLLNRKKQKTIEGRQLALMGNPEYYSEIDPEQIPTNERIENLSGAEDEIYNIKTLFKGSEWKSVVLINEQVTEDTFKALNRASVIHIATHGFFLDNKSANMNTALQETSQNPLLRSGLLLTGSGDFFQDNVYELNRKPGILTAFEVMNLDFENTDLVVLSACETGTGQVITGEGVFGLQRAFIVAGADALVMSLFKVSDETTQELMQIFYAELIKSGRIRESFTKAMRTQREKYDKPINWGAFTLVGGL